MTGLRAYRRHDDAAIVRFFARCHAADATVIEVDAGWWRGFVAMAMNRGGRDFAVAESDGEVVALLTSTLLEPSVRHVRILVEPAYRRRGLATALLHRVETTGDGPAAILQCQCPATWTAALAFYERHRFERVSEELEMTLPLTGREPPAAPAPYRIGEASGADAALARLHNEAYRGARGFAALDADGIAASRGLPGCRYLAAETDGSIAGFVQLVAERPGQGCVESLVVGAAHRGRGLGRALLEHGLARLRADGDAEALLRVEADNPAAVALYRSAGFTHVASNIGLRRRA